MTEAFEQTQPDEYVSTNEYKNRFTGPVGTLYLERQLSTIINWLRILRCEKILEVGAGHGQIANYLFECGYEVTCVVSPKAQITQLNAKIKLIRVPILEFKPNENFDCVIALKTLGHTDNPTRFISNISLNTRVVIVDYPSKISFARFNTIGFWIKKLIEKRLRTFDPLHPIDVERFFNEVGFKKKFSDGLFMLPIAFYRLFKSKELIRKIEELCNFSVFKSPRLECFVLETLYEAI
ncbi:MAG: class I SAM-dependent methyltransferase [Deltaproteobacteria bacterium]|nr:class I SAM-dependent methyltransferase [Deltaproteobacteria bacterium]